MKFEVGKSYTHSQVKSKTVKCIAISSNDTVVLEWDDGEIDTRSNTYTELDKWWTEVIPVMKRWINVFVDHNGDNYQCMSPLFISKKDALKARHCYKYLGDPIEIELKPNS